MVVGICPNCQHPEPRVLKRNRQIGGPICRPCQRKLKPPRPKEVCQRCRLPGFPSVRLSSGGIICDNCRNKDRYHDPAKWERCCRCGQNKPVAARRATGALCHCCYQNERQDQSRRCCIRCHRPKIVYRRIDDKPWCRPCWRKAERHGEPIVLKTMQTRSRADRISRPRPFLEASVGADTQPTGSVRPTAKQPDRSWSWCVDCGARQPRVITYGDRRSRCPRHGLAYLSAKKQRLAPAS